MPTTKGFIVLRKQVRVLAVYIGTEQPSNRDLAERARGLLDELSFEDYERLVREGHVSTEYSNGSASDLLFQDDDSTIRQHKAIYSLIRMANKEAQMTLVGRIVRRLVPPFFRR